MWPTTERKNNQCYWNQFRCGFTSNTFVKVEMRNWDVASLIFATRFLLVLGSSNSIVRRTFVFNQYVDIANVRRGGSVDGLLPPWGKQPVVVDMRNTTREVTLQNQAQTVTEVNSNCTPATTSSSVLAKIPQWKLSLPEPLRNKNSRSLQKLCMFGCIDIYVLGTAHVSNDSSADVQQLLSHIEPDCIFLELCDARMSLLGNQSNEPIKNVTMTFEKSLEANNVPRITWKERLSKWASRHIPPISSNNENNPSGTSIGNWFQTMSAVLLTSVQEDYAAQLGVELGGEFRCAHQYWYDQRQKHLRHHQAMDSMNHSLSHDWNNNEQRSTPHLILGDRPVQITLIRAWESLSWLARIKVCLGLVWSTLPFGKPSTEELRAWLASVMQNDGSDILSQSMDELRQSFPTLYTTIIAERDAWLAAKLIQTSHALIQSQNERQAIMGAEKSRRRRRSIVAVVGAGHVPGIVQWLTATQMEKTADQVLAELVTTKRWANDAVVQQELVPSWIYDVVEINTETNR